MTSGSRVIRCAWLLTACVGALWAATRVAGAEPQRSEELAHEILQATATHGGLVVHLGCGTGSLTAALRADYGLLIQGLDPDPAKVEQARRQIAASGLAGAVSIQQLSGPQLPYVDNLVRLLVAEDLCGVGMPEVLRVLAPGGVAYVKSPGDSGTWQKTVKPWPEGIDQWTHYLHGPDNNAVAHDSQIGPPRHMQWLAGPTWTRNHHVLNSISAVVTADGRLLAIVDEAPAANVDLPGKWMLVARDAFSGVTLWKRPLRSWSSNEIHFRSGPPQLPRLLVASGPRVYAPLGLNFPVAALDAATGRVAAMYPDTAGAEEIVLADRTLLVLRGEPSAEQAFVPPKGAKKQPPKKPGAKQPPAAAAAKNPPADAAVKNPPADAAVKNPPADATAEKPPAERENRGSFTLPNEKSLVAVDTQTGETLWTWSDPGTCVMPETLAADAHRAYFKVGQGVVALDLAQGSELWRSGAVDEKDKRRTVNFGRDTLVVAEDVVLCNMGDKLTALKADDGTQLWECEAGDGFHAPVDVFVIGGLVWQGRHSKDSVAPAAAQDFTEGRDLHTGQVKATNSICPELQTAGHHHRCYREKATDRFILTSKRGIELVDLAGDQSGRNNWVRGTCQYGILPANGLLYAPSHSCGCYMESKLRGFWALAPARSPLPPGEGQGEGGSDSRVVRGAGPHPAAAPPPSPGGRGEPADDWPTYRHDPLRSGVAGTEIPADLTQAWQAMIGGRLTQPVVAGQRVIVAGIDDGTVYGLNRENGRPAWQYVAGSRVDSPPTIDHQRVLFGSADGWVTCLSLADGSLVWRFRAARAQRQTVAMDRVESLWPVHGSVLVLGDVVYCSAGRSTWLDGGIDLWALEPASGKVLAQGHFESRHPQLAKARAEAKTQYDNKIDQNVTDAKTFLDPDQSDSFSMAGGTVSDVLVSDGTSIFLHQARFNTRLERQETLSRHLFSTSSLLDDSENHRTHWVLGTGDFSRVPVAYSWIVDRPGSRSPTIAVPTGLLLAYDAQAVWGVRNLGNANGKYELFKKAHRPFAADEPSQPDFRSVPAEELDPCLWKQPLPVRPSAVLRAGDRLLVAVSPVDSPADDPFAAYEGRCGGALWVCSESDGTRIAEHKLPCPVSWDGLSAAGGRLYLVTCDGKVLCLAGR